MLHDNEMPAPAVQDTGAQLGAANEVSLESLSSEINLSDPIEFLRRYSPDGPWVLSTFSPDTRGAGFLPSSAADAAAWVQQWNNKRDVYFLLGMPQGKPMGQPKKEAMLGTAWLWVDLDPRAGEDLQQERKRILASLTDALPLGIPAPTCIVDSGRGFWAFWQLSEPCLDPTLAERHNQQLANLFGANGDKCWNINRVGRLPGTVNMKTGNRARVVSYNGARYSLADMPAPIMDKPAVPTPTSAKSLFD